MSHRPLTNAEAELVANYASMVGGIAAHVKKRYAPHEDLTELRGAGLFGLIAAAQGLDQSRGILFRAYAYGAIRNSMVDYLRRKNARLGWRIVPIQTGTRDFGLVLPDESEQPAPDIIEHEEKIAALKRQMRRLPKREQKVVSLHYFHGATMADIAALFDLSRARICQILHGALDTLRCRLAADNL
jgi:RNA polymerase sigma factor (sigma-70 family)